MDLTVHAGQQYRRSSVRIRHPASLPKKRLDHGKPPLPRPGTSSLSTYLRLKDIGHSRALLSTTALCPGSTGGTPVPLEFQQMTGMISARLHDASLTLRERKAVFRQRQAAPRRTSAGNRPVVPAGTHHRALRAAGECAARAYRAVVSAPEGYTRAHTRGHRDHRRGQTGQANGWCVCRHRGGVAKRRPGRMFELRPVQAKQEGGETHHGHAPLASSSVTRSPVAVVGGSFNRRPPDSRASSCASRACKHWCIRSTSGPAAAGTAGGHGAAHRPE